MIFDKDVIAFNILDVLELDQHNVKMYNSGRNFDALSFRYKADTVLKTETKSCCLKDNSICYVPTRVNYFRAAKRDKLIVVHFHSLNYFSKEIEYFISRHPEKYAELFRQILVCWKAKEISYKHQCSALLYEIFAEFYKENKRAKNLPPIIEKSVLYIKSNYTNPDLSIKTAAEQSNISEVYFRKLFGEQFGISPKKYIISSRIKHAEGLITTGYYSLKEVAYMSGFSDYKYFSVEFKKHMGVSPSKFTYNYADKK